MDGPTAQAVSFTPFFRWIKSRVQAGRELWQWDVQGGQFVLEIRAVTAEGVGLEAGGARAGSAGQAAVHVCDSNRR